MQHKDHLQFKVGLFILLALAVIGIIILALGRESNLFEREFTVYADFADISGLRAGAPVYLAGLSVGQVGGIDFQENLNTKTIRVKLTINQSYQDRVRRNSVASIQSQGLLGDKLVFISVGSATEPMVEEGAILMSETPVDLYAFIEKGSVLLDSVNQAVEQIHTVLEGIESGEERGNLSGILSSLRNIFREVETGDGLAHSVIYDPNNALVTDVSAAAAELRETATALHDIAERIKQGEGSLGGLIADPTIYYDLKTLLGNANRNKLLKGIIRKTIEQKEEATIGGNK